MKYAFIFILFLSGCMSQSKLASLCASRFPVQQLDSNTTKSIIITVDSTNYDIVNELQSTNDSLLQLKQNVIEKIKFVKDSTGCANVISSYKDQFNHYIDKINSLTKQVKGNEKISENTTTIVKIEDRAALAVKDNEIAILQSKLDKEIIKSNDNEIKACLEQKKAVKRLWWLLSIVGIIGIYTVLKFKNVLPAWI